MLGSLQRHCALHVFRPLNPNLSLRKVSTFRAPSSPTPRSNKPPPFWTSSQQPNISSVRRISFHRQYIHFVHKISFQKRYAALEDRQTSGKVSKVYIYTFVWPSDTILQYIHTGLYIKSDLCHSSGERLKPKSCDRAGHLVTSGRDSLIPQSHIYTSTRQG